MSRSRKDQRKHRRKAYFNGTGELEHSKREERREGGYRYAQTRNRRRRGWEDYVRRNGPSARYSSLSGSDNDRS